MNTEAQKAAVKRYNLEHTKQFNMRLNLKTDAEVVAKLESVPASRLYIKQLILDDIARGENGLCPPSINPEEEANYSDDKAYVFRLNKNFDWEAINLLDAINDKDGFISALLRDYIRREKAVPHGNGKDIETATPVIHPNSSNTYIG